MFQFLTSMVVNPEVQVLNISKQSDTTEKINSVELAQSINKQILKLFSAYASEDGNEEIFKNRKMC
jgi:hypothetical protein